MKKILRNILVGLYFTSLIFIIFVSTSSCGREASSPDKRYYINSKKTCDEAVKIVIKIGDVTGLSSQEKTKVTDLLEIAIAEANKVSPNYIQKVHPRFPEKYKQYVYALSLMMRGLQTDNTALVLAGTYGYNEFAEWMQAHKKELSF